MQKRESIIALQEIDCNCNNCFFMQRNIEAFNKSVDLHMSWQLYDFENRKRKADPLVASQMKFQFNRIECRINYGFCAKYNKEVSFIPDTCQLETQHCFKHRSMIN